MFAVSAAITRRADESEVASAIMLVLGYTYRNRTGYLGRREPTYDAMQGWILVNLVSLDAFPSGYSPIVWCMNILDAT